MRNKAFYQIKRETSKYNKYMKWHLELFRENKTLLSSEYFRTEREALASIERSKQTGKEGFPIGDHLSYTDYTEMH